MSRNQKIQAVKLTPEIFIKLSYRIEEILKTMLIFIHNHQYFRVITIDSKDQNIIQKTIKWLIQLTGSNDDYLAFLGGQILKSLCFFKNEKQSKFEALNKQLIIGEKIGLMESLIVHLG